MALRLGVLDQSPIAAGRTARDAITETLDLAVRAEALGFERFWVAEHHASKTFAGPCPEILMAQIAASTRSIRVGSGGVMLMHYAALKVAEQFRMLEALHPGRIDLGIGRAPGTDAWAIRALSPHSGSPDVEQRQFEAKLQDIGAYLRDEHAPVFAMPVEVGMPELWLLGSGSASAALAAKLGWGFCFAQFISGAAGLAVVDAYREAFVPSPWLAAPRVAIGAFVLAADDDAEAKRLVSSTELWYLQLQRGRQIAIPSPSEAQAFTWDPAAVELRRRLRSLQIHGGPATVESKLRRLSALYQTEEFLILTLAHDHGARVHSYEILAQIARRQLSASADPGVEDGARPAQASG